MRLLKDDITYELCRLLVKHPALKYGALRLVRVNNNPENFDIHTYVKYGSQTIKHFELKINWILNFLRNSDIEGVVFHHQDGRMAKITLD